MALSQHELTQHEMDHTSLRPWLARCPLIAILRGVRPDEAVPIGEALARAGIAIVEVPLNSPDPIESIRRLVQHFGTRLLIGAGTVVTPAQVEEVDAFGGRLIVMPHADVAVVRAAKHHGLLACPGFATPTEAFAALHAGADGIKLFPAEASSPAILKSLRAVLPAETLVLPVGGIDAANLRPWLGAGAAGFGIGSAIYKPGDWRRWSARRRQPWWRPSALRLDGRDRSGRASGRASGRITFGQFAKAAQPDQRLVGEARDDLQFATHRLDKPPQRGEVHVRAPFQLRDRSLADMQVGCELVLRHRPRAAQFGQRQFPLQCVREGSGLGAGLGREAGAQPVEGVPARHRFSVYFACRITLMAAWCSEDALGAD